MGGASVGIFHQIFKEWNDGQFSVRKHVPKLSVMMYLEWSLENLKMKSILRKQ